MQVPAEWNATARSYAYGQVIHEAFDARAERSPGAIALIEADRQISYAALRAASHTYADELRAAGVRPGDAIALLMPKSAELVAVMLAVLRCGAAYAGIDPAWPGSRVAGIVTRLRSPVVPGRDWHPSCDVAAAARRSRPAAVPDVRGPRVHGSQVACVVFTSGTTGQPKGILVPHRGVTRLSAPSSYGAFSERAVMPLAASVAWDGFTVELWGTLLDGGTVVVVGEPYLVPPLVRELRSRFGVNRVFLTTSLFHVFADEDAGALTGLACVLVGGEALAPSRARVLLADDPGADLINLYGPAEVSVLSTAHHVRLADCGRRSGIPIGRPVANTAVQVLDGDRPCEVGETGELCVLGDGLSPGYLDAPELTAERFTEVAGHRLYRTGDLGFWSEEGLLFYAGRADRQVKIRGHRVEPAEVERAMLGQPGILSAAVVPRPGPDGSVQDLIACYVSTDGRPLEPAAVRARLSEALPGYLVPAALCQVGRLPLAPNGKLDAGELLARAAQLADPAAGPPPARRVASDQTRADLVADAFAGVLRRGDVPSNATLFELGGSSLDAGRVCAKLSLAIGVPIPASAVMSNPTVASLAAWLGDHSEAPAAPDGSPGGVPLTPAQQGFLLSHHLKHPDLENHCLTIFRIEGAVDATAVAAAVRDVHRRHEALRARYPLAEVPLAQPVASEPDVTILPAAADERTAECRLLDHLSAPFDLGNGLVWRAGLASRPGGAVLGLAVHHVAFDGWSQSVIARDLGIACSARQRGAAPTFPAPAPTMLELHRERQARRALADLDRQRDYWASALAGLPDLAVPRPASARPGIGLAQFELPRIGRSARGLRSSGATLFDAIFCAYASALAEVSGQAEFGVGVPVAQRASVAEAAAVGCLLDTLCLPVKAHGDAAATLTGMRSRLAQARAAQDISFADVVRLTNPRRTDRTPLFQTMFVFQNTAPARLRLPGCHTRADTPAPLAPMFEIVTEAWPAAGGALAVRISFDRAKVAGEFVGDLAWAYRRMLGGSARDSGGKGART